MLKSLIQSNNSIESYHAHDMKDLMKISKVIFHKRPISSYSWWECKKKKSNSEPR